MSSGPSRIRTDTVQYLKLPPLPLGYRTIVGHPHLISQGILEPPVGLEPTTSSLPRKYSTC